MENNGLFDRGENGGNVLAREVIRTTGIKAFLLGYKTRAESTTVGKKEWKLHITGWQLICKYATYPTCLTLFLNSTEDTDRKLLDWNYSVN